MSKPIVWTIAGSDSGGGAGIQADLHTIQDLSGFGCTVITALTAQNSQHVDAVHITPPDILSAQLETLDNDLPAQAIKLGMIGNQASMTCLKKFLVRQRCPIICDPVMVSSSGATLLSPDDKNYLVNSIFPLSTLITPNLAEASVLLDHAITEIEQMPQAAQKLLALGCKAVLLKGGHHQGNLACDYFIDGTEAFWLVAPRQHHAHTHGSGCTLSAAIATALARGYTLKDALVIAKSYVHQGIRLATPYGAGPGPVAHDRWPQSSLDLPWIVTEGIPTFSRELPFPSCTPPALGFYPIVPNYEWLERVLRAGVKTVQLRNKTLNGAALVSEIERCVTLARHYQARLFINDYWELAVQFNAYGVHLGQTDITTEAIAQLKQAEIRLGISTHSFWELARAHTYQPSYIACGAIFPTTTKNMETQPVGLSYLKECCVLSPYPVVAIGGIKLPHVPEIHACGANSIAVVTAITEAHDPEVALQQWQTACSGG